MNRLRPHLLKLITLECIKSQKLAPVTAELLSNLVYDQISSGGHPV